MQHKYQYPDSPSRAKKNKKKKNKGSVKTSMKQQIVLNTNLGNTQAKAPKMTNKYQQLYNNYNHNEKTQSSSVKHCSGAFSG